MENKVSGAIAIPKTSWGCAPALPNRIRMVFLGEVFSITSRRQKKSFLIQQFFKNVGEVWASSPDRCPQAAKFLCHAFGTRRGW